MIWRQAAAGAAFIGLAVSASGQVINGDSYGEERSGSWYGVFVSHGTDMRFRSYTLSGNWGLTVDLLVPTCNVVFSLALAMPGDSLAQDIPEMDISGVLRVDQEQTHDVRLHMRGAMGDTSMIYTAYSVPNVDEFISELRSGQLLRSKITVGTQDYYQTFALNGFGPAFDHEYRACTLGKNAL